MVGWLVWLFLVLFCFVAGEALRPVKKGATKKRRKWLQNLHSIGQETRELHFCKGSYISNRESSALTECVRRLTRLWSNIFSVDMARVVMCYWSRGNRDRTHCD